MLEPKNDWSKYIGREDELETRCGKEVLKITDARELGSTGTHPLSVIYRVDYRLWHEWRTIDDDFLRLKTKRRWKTLEEIKKDSTLEVSYEYGFHFKHKNGETVGVGYIEGKLGTTFREKNVTQKAMEAFTTNEPLEGK